MTPSENLGRNNSPTPNRKMVILTDGHSSPLTAKTACCVLRYCPDEVVAVLDQSSAGKTADQLLGVGGSIPVIDRLEAAPEAKTLLIGIAPPGGRIPVAWRPIILSAIARGMDILSGLHDFLCEDQEFVTAAAGSNSKLIDVRRSHEKDVADRVGIREQCLRIHTVGQDCSVGKMLVSVELTRALSARQVSAKFIATGQTGVIVEGDGCAIDCVVADFVSGAVEKMILAQQHHDILMIEGQGSLAHPRYSAVTLGLLHGCMPHGMILCYEAGRDGVYGMNTIPLTDLGRLRNNYETMANLMGPSEVIGIAMNSRLLTAEQAESERERVREEFQLPVCDVVRDGPNELIDAILDLQRRHQGKGILSDG